MDLVDRVARAIQQVQYAGGLNPAQWEALRYLGRANRYSRSPTAVAEYLGTTKGTVSQTLKALESKGCIMRRACTGDRRGVELSLTEAGANVLRNDPLDRVCEAAKEFSAQFGAAQAAFAQLLRRLQQSGGICEFGVCDDCTHLCRECADVGEGGALRCGVTGEVLSADEIGQICINFESQLG